jgi:hypothetical protein
VRVLGLEREQGQGLVRVLAPELGLEREQEQGLVRVLAPELRN